MAGEQQFKVFLSFKDEATGKFIKATEEQVAAIKKLGITVKKEGAGVGIDLDKMSVAHEKAGRAARFHRTTITELQGSIGSLRNVLLLYFFIMRPFINLYKQTTEAAIAQENAEMKLAAAFAATGRGSQDSIKNISNLASAMQNLTGYSDDQIIAASAILATYKLNESQIKKTIPVLLDLTAALKTSGDTSANLEVIAKRLGLAFTGNAAYLKRYGIVIDESTAKYGSFDQILRAVEKSTGGVAEAMGKTFAGQTNIFKAAINDLYESIGNIITKSPVLISSLQLISGAIREITTNIESSRESTNNFLETWKSVAAGIIGVIDSIKFFWRAFLQGLRTIEIVVAKIIEWFGTLIIKIAEFGLKLSELTPLTKHLAVGFQQVIDETKVWRDTAKYTAEGITNDFSRTAEAMNRTLDSMVDKYQAVELGVVKVIQTQKEGLKDLKVIAEDTTENLGNQFNVMNDFMVAAVTGMRNAMVDGFFKIIHGEFDKLSDIVVSFGDMMLKVLLQIAVNMALIKVGLGTYLGFPGGVAHTGGYMYADNLIYGQPRRRFHSGGEVPATLLPGEYVLNRNAVRNIGVDNLDRLNRGEAGGSSTTINNYYIQTIDERSLRERLQEHSDIYINAAERGIKDNTSLRKTSQRFG